MTTEPERTENSSSEHLESCRVDAVVICHCGTMATCMMQMHTHECDPTPMCDHCFSEHEQTAKEINEHEMSRFGGAYGLVDYSVSALG